MLYYDIKYYEHFDDVQDVFVKLIATHEKLKISFIATGRVKDFVQTLSMGDTRRRRYIRRRRHVTMSITYLNVWMNMLPKHCQQRINWGVTRQSCQTRRRRYIRRRRQSKFGVVFDQEQW